MKIYKASDLVKSQRDLSYLEFLRAETMSAGIYHIPAGTEDPQQPHTEDEVYFVIEGHASIQVEGESESIGPGSIIYVKARQEHRFFDIEDDLSVLVIFAPAEGEGK